MKEAAQRAGVTAETLRHYDRIGLVRPIRIENGNRYYSNEQILIIGIIKRLQSIGLTLDEVKQMFAVDSLLQVREALVGAADRCDERIRELRETKRIISRAIEQYSNQSKDHETEVDDMRDIEERYLLLSQHLTKLDLATLFDYQRHYRAELGPRFERYRFKDQAGIFIEDGIERIFIECERPRNEDENIFVLPSGRYLSISCSIEDKKETIEKVRSLVRERTGVAPRNLIVLVEVTGIARWRYIVQARID